MATARVERRLSAILAADVVGYSRLMERDEDRTLARLKALRTELVEPLIAEHQGRVVKLMGDGLLAEFASVVDAARCAILIQRGVAEREAGVPEAERIRLRIGINLGDVVREADGDLYGDGVNVAARLEQLAEPGGVVVSGTAYDQLHGKLDLALEFAGEQRVKNIERLVRAYRVRLDGTAARLRLPSRRVRRVAAPVVAALLLLALAAGGAWRLWPGEAVAGKPSVAVLPFDNLGGDETTGRLADGITEDTITDLARHRELDVIARNSTAVYKGKPVDVRKVGKDLGVGYVLEGSIQRQGDRVRVTAQLIDAGTGAHVWTERWDRPAGDVFAVQAEVAERVANALAGHSVLLREGAAAARRKRPADLGAYDLWTLATEAFLRGGKADLEQGLSFVDAAIAKDPGLTRAYTRKAWLLNGLRKYGRNDNETFAEMERLARKAISVDPYDANGYVALAFAASTLGRNAEAAAATERALELNPGSADILNAAAQNMAYFGRPEEGAAMCDRSFRLNPTPPDWYHLGCHENYFLARRYQDALNALDRWGAHADLDPGQLVYRAASQSELGRAEAATASVEELGRRFPEVSFEHLMNTGWVFEREQEQRQILAGAKKAGVRVCATEEELKRFPSPRRLPECSPKPVG